MDEILPGTILIADPFLKDPHFLRSVIFLCEHRDEGSFGFVLTRKYDKVVGDLITDLEDCRFPVYFGGPVQLDTIHFLHTCPGLITSGIEIIDGIYWGGDFEEAVNLIRNDKITQNQIRFFIGYSGWGEGQLQSELKEKSWLITTANKKLVFHRNVEMIWKEALKQLGGEYEQLIHYPIDPQLN
jgi:putative transcriptional regulator